MLVHRHRPAADGHMRVKFKPMYHEGGTEVLGFGSNPSIEKVGVKQLIDLVQLQDGVLAHSAARRLDHRNFTWNEDVVDAAVGGTIVSSSRCLEYQRSMPGQPLRGG